MARIFLCWTVALTAAVSGCGSPAQLSGPAQLVPAVTEETAHGGATIVPAKLDPNCRDGRARLYDECSDQFDLLDRARQRAAAENKVVLVSYGAEWCKWCHIFIDTVQRAPETDALRSFVTRSFVIVHIDAQYGTNGGAVLRKTGAARAYNIGLPFFFSLNQEGRYAGHLVNERVLVLRSEGEPKDGFDREKLLADLKGLYKRAAR